MSVESRGKHARITATSASASEKSVSVAATGAIFTAHCGPEGSLVVAVDGDIDMRSAPMFADFVCSRVSRSSHVTLDLSSVDFFGIAGLSVFEAVRDYASSIDATWSVVAGRSVTRLLDVSGMGSTLPVVSAPDA